jgi:PTS system mannose-specific IIB component/fructoselysine and glucoselysine-specific PTS system IIB component
VPILLYRVDERLIHGQVTLGWGGVLEPTHYVVVDDPLSRSGWERDLYELGTPAEAVSDFVGVEEARERLASWRADPGRVLLLTRDLDHMLRLSEGGRLSGETVNLGGIHHAPGRRERLPYLFLDAGDEGRIRTLLERGVTVEAQDLPGASKTPAAELLDD